MVQGRSGRPKLGKISKNIDILGRFMKKRLKNLKLLSFNPRLDRKEARGPQIGVGERWFIQNSQNYIFTCFQKREGGRKNDYHKKEAWSKKERDLNFIINAI